MRCGWQRHGLLHGVDSGTIAHGHWVCLVYLWHGVAIIAAHGVDIVTTERELHGIAQREDNGDGGCGLEKRLETLCHGDCTSFDRLGLVYHGHQFVVEIVSQHIVFALAFSIAEESLVAQQLHRHVVLAEESAQDILLLKGGFTAPIAL